MLQNFRDGLASLTNALVNRRNALNQNVLEKRALTDVELRNAYKTGLGNKVVRLKSGAALKDTLQFENTHDGDLYNERLAKHVKLATRFMLSFGRGIIVMYEDDADLSKPMPPSLSPRQIKLKVFSGDMVTIGNVSIDLTDDRYYKPLSYTVRGQSIHWTRVIDFTYVQPVETEAPNYRYGGISEFELIHEQMISDGIIERAGATIVEKNSSFVYKITGFKEALQQKREEGILRYIAASEDSRSAYGALVTDAEDDVTAVNQTLTNLADVDQSSLRRVAMVTGIPVAVLVGENVKGLNSTGDNEMRVFQDTIEQLESDYLLEPIKDLCARFGITGVKFKENQGETPYARIEYEVKAVTNALALSKMGEDSQRYLEERGVIEKDQWRELFAPNDDEPELPEADVNLMLDE